MSNICSLRPGVALNLQDNTIEFLVSRCAPALFFVYAAHFLRPLCGDSACLFCSPRTELLLIYRIQSHTHPKRRKFCLKHAGQKSVKDKLPEQRKGPKRAAECRLKVPTHIWEQDAAGSNPVIPTISGFSSSGRAPPCQGGGSEFEPRKPLHTPL